MATSLTISKVFQGGIETYSVKFASYSNHSVKAQVVFSRQEQTSGLAHYTEHLTWLNTASDSRDFDRHSNAWTNSYAVGYWLSGDPGDLPELLTDIKGVFNPLTLPESFAVEERDIVLREYVFHLANDPVARAGEAMNAFLYAGNSIAASVIGTPAEISTFTYDQAKALHAETHRPDNAVLVVTGDVTSRQLRRALRAADWPEGVPAAQILTPPAFNLGPPALEVFEEVDDDAAPRLIWRRVITLPEAVQFDLLDARTALLRDILDTNLPGGLGGPLRYDAAIARSFDISIWPVNERHIELQFLATPDSNMSLAELSGAFEDQLSLLAANGIPQETFTRVLARFEGFWPDWDNHNETTEWMAEYTLDRVSILRPPLSERELKRINDDLSLTTTNALLQQLAGDGRTAIAYIGLEERFQ